MRSVIFAPLIEEIAFRGVMLHMSRKAVPKWAVLVFTAVCFGLWHRNLPQFIYTTLWGLVYGYVALSTGRLQESILMHFLSNLMAILGHSARTSDVFGAQPFWVGLTDWIKELSPSVSMIGLVLCACAVVFLLGFIRREYQKEQAALGSQ